MVDRFQQHGLGATGLEHGGQLAAAAHHFGIAEDDWLDLSTGINPLGWPVPELPARVWQRLPENDDQLEQAARDYYHACPLLAVAGSQAAIQLLPRLRPPSRVGFLSPGYGEHPHRWRQQGHQVQRLDAEQLDAAVEQLDVVVLCRPNNPDGTVVPRPVLQHWHQSLARRGGWLVVDEAFADADPAMSIADLASQPGFIVLRSLGKFFGLAGLRLGFVLAAPELLRALAERIGPWSVSHPARWVGAHALRDRHWQQRAQRDLASACVRLDRLLAQYELAPVGGASLFRWLPLPQSGQWQHELARQGVLVRHFHDPGALRFGLPGGEDEWMHLQRALQAIRQ